ncbi:MAG: hypothetical protein K6A44_00300 [bacterium]|nr:hypothetical protein [bacterium]
MQVNSINNTAFGAKFSRDLESKVIAYGKYLQRSKRFDEYEELKNSAQVIKTLFPEGTIKVKPNCKFEIIRDINGIPVFKIPIHRAGVFLERYGEADVSLVKNGLLSVNSKIELEQIKEMASRLQSYRHFLEHKVFSTPEKEMELTQKVRRDLL